MNAHELKRIMNDNNTILNELELNMIIKNYLEQEKNMIDNLSKEEKINYIASHLNFFDYRTDYENTRFNVEIGDICYIDYGINYIRECGYFHLGLVIEIKHSKYLVLPMTSSIKTFEKAVFWKQRNLLALPSISNVDKNTTLFLNDARFINSSRIINKISTMNKDSKEFIHIKEVFYKYIQNEGI